MKSFVFPFFYRRKNYLSHIIIQRNNIFDTNILSRGYPTKWKNYGNSRGWGYDKHPLEWKFHGLGGLKQNCPPCVVGAGGGEVWIFSKTTQFGKFGITVICVSWCFRYPLLKLRQCLEHHRVASSDTKVNSDLGIPFLYYASV